MKPLGFISCICFVAALGLRTTVVAGLYYFPFSVAADSHGNVYVSGKQNKIVKLSPDGTASDYVLQGYVKHRDGVGTAAMLEDGKDLAIDSTDNLYIVDNNKVRKVTPEAVVTTLAGNDRSAFVDGAGAAASLKNPKYIAVGPDARVYVVDRAETEYAVIRIIPPGGVVTTRKGGDGGPRVHVRSPPQSHHLDRERQSGDRRRQQQDRHGALVSRFSK